MGSKSISFALPDTGNMGMIESDLLANEKIGQFILAEWVNLRMKT